MEYLPTCSCKDLSSRSGLVGKLLLTEVLYKKKKEEEEEDDKTDYFSDLVIDSHVLEGTFASVSFCLHTWFGGCSFFGRFPAGASVW